MNPPEDNPAVMPLEEAQEILREDIAICDQNIRICDENLYDEEAALLRKHRGAYLAALHHLEAGKRDNLPAIDLERACRIAAERLAIDSQHLAHIQKIIEDAFEQAATEATQPEPKGES